ncbi:hypothetical protein BDN72DRAFT_901315 [Pluteus cervinus]|uniref:Uncharacterized protein n=1 Tax=Pluteus cervinus TaxID=181527 RepID=A0ACD3AGF4_9AGAR|nr:hypothetical protein BDN72DRAFT_901315 [Pluteus cervinus]
MDDKLHPQLLTIACRFIPYDQWLVTHVDPTWKVKQLKLWILSKCLSSGLYTFAYDKNHPHHPQHRINAAVTNGGLSFLNTPILNASSTGVANAVGGVVNGAGVGGGKGVPLDDLTSRLEGGLINSSVGAGDDENAGGGRIRPASPIIFAPDPRVRPISPILFAVPGGTGRGAASGRGTGRGGAAAGTSTQSLDSTTTEGTVVEGNDLPDDDEDGDVETLDIGERRDGANSVTPTPIANPSTIPTTADGSGPASASASTSTATLPGGSLDQPQDQPDTAAHGQHEHEEDGYGYEEDDEWDTDEFVSLNGLATTGGMVTADGRRTRVDSGTSSRGPAVRGYGGGYGYSGYGYGYGFNRQGGSSVGGGKEGSVGVKPQSHQARSRYGPTTSMSVSSTNAFAYGPTSTSGAIVPGRRGPATIDESRSQSPTNTIHPSHNPNHNNVSSYTLARFSTGQILEDDFQLSWYDLSPYELVELHGGDILLSKYGQRRYEREMERMKEKEMFSHLSYLSYHNSGLPGSGGSGSGIAGGGVVGIAGVGVGVSGGGGIEGGGRVDSYPIRVIRLDRTDISSYVLPYWEGWVRALRVVWRDDHKHGYYDTYGDVKKASSGMLVYKSGGTGLGIEYVDAEGLKKMKEREKERRARQRDREAVLGDPKQRGIPGRKTRLEWKDRWVVIRGGVLTLCKDREDPSPTHQLPLSAITSLRGADHLAKSNIGSKSRKSKSIGGSHEMGEKEMRIVCAKFRVSKEQQQPQQPQENKKKKNEADEAGGSQSKATSSSQTQPPSSYGIMGLGMGIWGGVVPAATKEDKKDGSPSLHTKSSGSGISFLGRKEKGRVFPGLGKKEKKKDKDNERKEAEGAEDQRRFTTSAPAGHGADRKKHLRGSGSDNSELLFSKPKASLQDDTMRLSDDETKALRTSSNAKKAQQPGRENLTDSDTMSSPIFANSQKSSGEDSDVGMELGGFGYKERMARQKKMETQRMQKTLEDEKKGKEKAKDKETKPASVQEADKEQETRAYTSILRVLHRHAPRPISSSFISRVPGLDNLNFPTTTPAAGAKPSSPLSPTHPRQRPRDDSSESEAEKAPSANPTSPTPGRPRPQHPPALANLSHPTQSDKRFGALPYPEWRVEVTERAQKAGLGDIGKAMEWLVWGQSQQMARPRGLSPATSFDFENSGGGGSVEGGVENTPNPTIQRDRERRQSQSLRHKRQSMVPTAGSGGPKSTTTPESSKTTSQTTVVEGPEGVLHKHSIDNVRLNTDKDGGDSNGDEGSAGDYSDYSDDEDREYDDEDEDANVYSDDDPYESAEESEVEWQGWMADLHRQGKVMQQDQHTQQYQGPPQHQARGVSPKSGDWRTGGGSGAVPFLDPGAGDGGRPATAGAIPSGASARPESPSFSRVRRPKSSRHAVHASGTIGDTSSIYSTSHLYYPFGHYSDIQGQPLVDAAQRQHRVERRPYSAVDEHRRLQENRRAFEPSAVVSSLYSNTQLLSANAVAAAMAAAAGVGEDGMSLIGGDGVESTTTTAGAGGSLGRARARSIGAGSATSHTSSSGAGTVAVTLDSQGSPHLSYTPSVNFGLGLGGLIEGDGGADGAGPSASRSVGGRSHTLSTSTSNSTLASSSSAGTGTGSMRALTAAGSSNVHPPITYQHDEFGRRPSMPILTSLQTFSLEPSSGSGSAPMISQRSSMVNVFTGSGGGAHGFTLPGFGGRPRTTSRGGGDNTSATMSSPSSPVIAHSQTGPSGGFDFYSPFYAKRSTSPAPPDPALGPTRIGTTRTTAAPRPGTAASRPGTAVSHQHPPELNISPLLSPQTYTTPTSTSSVVPPSISTAPTNTTTTVISSGGSPARVVTGTASPSFATTGFSGTPGYPSGYGYSGYDQYAHGSRGYDREIWDDDEDDEEGGERELQRERENDREAPPFSNLRKASSNMSVRLGGAGGTTGGSTTGSATTTTKGSVGRSASMLTRWGDKGKKEKDKEKDKDKKRPKLSVTTGGSSSSTTNANSSAAGHANASNAGGLPIFSLSPLTIPTPTYAHAATAMSPANSLKSIIPMNAISAPSGSGSLTGTPAATPMGTPTGAPPSKRMGLGGGNGSGSPNVLVKPRRSRDRLKSERRASIGGGIVVGPTGLGSSSGGTTSGGTGGVLVKKSSRSVLRRVRSSDSLDDVDERLEDGLSPGGGAIGIAATPIMSTPTRREHNRSQTQAVTPMTSTSAGSTSGPRKKSGFALNVETLMRGLEP